jgi:hypothetical protein
MDRFDEEARTMVDAWVDDHRVTFAADAKDMVPELAAALRGAYDAGRATGRADVAKYSNAVGQIEAAIGYAGARPLRETVQAVRAMAARLAPDQPATPRISFPALPIDPAADALADRLVEEAFAGKRSRKLSATPRDGGAGERCANVRNTMIGCRVGEHEPDCHAAGLPVGACCGCGEPCPACTKPAAPPAPVTYRAGTVPAESDAHRAARLIATIPYLYGGYTMKDRGPVGLLLDALRILHPEAREAFDRTGDWDAVFAEFYSEEEEPLARDFTEPGGDGGGDA